MDGWNENLYIIDYVDVDARVLLTLYEAAKYYVVVFAESTH